MSRWEVVPVDRGKKHVSVWNAGSVFLHFGPTPRMFGFKGAEEIL